MPDSFFVIVNNGNFVFFVYEELCQLNARKPRTYDYNFHGFPLSFYYTTL